jgi:hypothetical protein
MSHNRQIASAQTELAAIVWTFFVVAVVESSVRAVSC